jgi:hypothetical protein
MTRTLSLNQQHAVHAKWCATIGETTMLSARSDSYAVRVVWHKCIGNK